MAESWSEFQAARGLSRGDGLPDAAITLIETYPLIGKFLADYTLESGVRAAKQGSVTLFFEGGRLKACLNDHYAQLKGFLTLDSLNEPFAAIEVAMRAGTVDWKREKNRG